MVMKINVNRNNKTPIYIQIKNYMIKKILDGELLKDFRLPPERILAAQLGVHRNTVIKAYHALIEEDFVQVSSSPRGYFVCYDSMKRQAHQNFSDKRLSSFEYMVKEEYINLNKLFYRLFDNSLSSNMISFAAQLAAPDTYPKNQVREMLCDLLSSDQDDVYGYCHAQGLESLRVNVARLLIEREVAVMPSEVQIVAESGQALDYITKLYMNPGDVIVAEEPILTDTFNYFQLMGIRPVLVPMDQEGMDMAYLEQVLIKHNPRFIYTVPNFHNPTGSVMSLERRYELLNLSYKYSIPIIEEDCDYEFHYEGPRLPPLKAIDKKNNVIYVDSFIFTFLPGVRIAYMAAPKKVISKVSKMVDMEQIFINSIGQHLVSQFLSRGYYVEHVEYLREYYRKKRDLICEELKKIKDISFEIPKGGTCLWCKMPANINQTRMLKNAQALGVSFVPGFLFYPYGNQGENYMRLSFSDVSKEDIPKGIQLLNEAMQQSIAE